MGTFPLLLFLVAPSILSIRISSDLHPIPFSNDIEEDDGSLSVPADAIGRPKFDPLPLQDGFDPLSLNNECFCSYGVEDGVCLENETCIKESGAACFHAMEEIFNEDQKQMETLHKYGCATLEKGSGASHFTCHSSSIPFKTPKSIACCYEGNLCNLNITPPEYSSMDVFEPDYEGPLFSRTLIPLLLITSLIIILILAILSIILFRRRSALKKRAMFETKDIEEEELMIDTSGSGSRGGAMIQRTVAQDLKIEGVIGQGRYGQVRKALYRGSYVAVKTFYTTDEESWQNEREIYHSEMFNHANVLQFVAADICSVNSTTQMLLITDYHIHGSLSEYLQSPDSPGISSDEALSLAFSIVCGLEHLHSSVHGTGGMRKPQIAHRDLKSRNIIVKRPGVCCIADFGLALRFGPTMIPEHPKVQVGTKRYMAPEVLDKSLNPEIFNHFLMADIYSLALIQWEILSGVQLTPFSTSPVSERRNDHSDSSGLGESVCSDECPKPARAKWEGSGSRTPFDGIVTADASLDDMTRVVCTQKCRPNIDPLWTASKKTGLATLADITIKCWHHTPAVRPSALRVKLELRALLDRLAEQKRLTVKEDTKDPSSYSQATTLTVISNQ